ncbi:hypothetical protein ABTX35_39250 [Streptomyces sp. NPDC096080]
MTQQQPPPCGPCSGQGGATVDTSSGGITRQTWHTCTTCKGSGQQP